MASDAEQKKLPPRIGVPEDGGSELARRTHPEPEHAYRGPFTRDVARVLHARAFRRLAGKTQVFTRVPTQLQSDHFRSRLTHTLEVAQISRTLSRGLGLNAELAEALGLAHDIGHPPFGHAGEAALDQCLRAHGLKFDHNLHALRIVSWFEERYAGFRGLNLTLGVREGIVKHSHDYAAEEHAELSEYFLDRFPPLEAQLIDLADEIAYLTADLDDGLDSGILNLELVRWEAPLFRRHHDEALARFPGTGVKLTVYEALRQMLNELATDLMEETRRQVALAGVETLDELRRAPRRLAALSPEMEAERERTKRFLYAHLYLSPNMEEDHAHAAQVIRELFEALMAEPARLAADHQSEIETEGLARTVADYIAGMTDGFVEQVWSQMCGRRSGR